MPGSQVCPRSSGLCGQSGPPGAEWR